MSRCKKLLVMLASATLAMPAFGQEKPAPRENDEAKMAARANQVRGDEITPAQQAAVEKGLAYLASKQARNGSFGGGYGSAAGHAGITALGGLAFMAAGNLPGRGKYGDNVQKALDFVIANTQESGLIA